MRKLRQREAVPPRLRIERHLNLFGSALERDKQVPERIGPAKIGNARIVAEHPEPLACALQELRARTADGPFADVLDDRHQFLVVADACMHLGKLAHVPRSTIRRTCGDVALRPSCQAFSKAVKARL